MATTADDSPESDDFSLLVPIVAYLVFHIAGQGNKKKMTKKDMKTKEFAHTFSATRPNYLKFLITILAKHHISKLQMTDHRHYSCKMQVLPSK